MKKNVIALVTVLFFSASAAYSQQMSNDEISNYLDGKKFYALLGQSCAELADGGGYMESEHCVLIFNKGKVAVKRYTNRNYNYERREEPRGKDAIYIIKADTIKAKGLEYLTLIIDKSGSSLRIYAPYDYFNPKERGVYFTEIDKKTKEFSGPLPNY